MGNGRDRKGSGRLLLKENAGMNTVLFNGVG